ncbi:Retron-type reverse transcriptase [Actinobacillus indolicus]|nr:Retron-type reverse transcriptase [Actinobacillus indolicus]VTU06207.1 Retron-type reverse transcriptase [Actinobacillus indolicus]
MLLELLKKEFLLNEKEAISFINTAPNRYKHYNIQKRHGGEREIAEPTRSLKKLQRWVLNKYFSTIECHSAAIAYSKNKSIKDFALPHAKKKYLLKMDFKDFFNSIKSDDFNLFLKERKLELSDDEVDYITNIFFCRNKKNNDLYLSIGAPTSPFISNLIMIDFDEQINAFCNKEGITYTRYADDLAFSTNIPNILFLIPPEIEKICSKVNYPKNLQINMEKTVFTSKKHNRTLTGLVISNEGKISIGREKKRQLRAIAHKASLKLLSSEDLEKFKGMLAFLLSIDPDFSNSLKSKAKI